MDAEQLLVSESRAIESLQSRERSSFSGQRFGQIRIERERPVKASKGFLMAIQIVQDGGVIAPYSGDGGIDGDDRVEGLQRLVLAVQSHERRAAIDKRFDEAGLVRYG